MAYAHFLIFAAIGQKTKILEISLVVLDGEGAVDTTFIWNVLKYSNLRKICLL